MAEDKGRKAGAVPLEVARYVDGLKYPATKGEILRFAREKNAPDNVMAVLEEIPEQDYFRMADIIPEFEETEAA